MIGDQVTSPAALSRQAEFLRVAQRKDNGCSVTTGHTGRGGGETPGTWMWQGTVCKGLDGLEFKEQRGYAQDFRGGTGNFRSACCVLLTRRRQILPHVTSLNPHNHATQSYPTDARTGSPEKNSPKVTEPKHAGPRLRGSGIRTSNPLGPAACTHRQGRLHYLCPSNHSAPCKGSLIAPHAISEGEGSGATALLLNGSLYYSRGWEATVITQRPLKRAQNAMC